MKDISFRIDYSQMLFEVPRIRCKQGKIIQFYTLFDIRNNEIITIKATYHSESVFTICFGKWYYRI